jgi:hypothetical protein
MSRIIELEVEIERLLDHRDALETEAQRPDCVERDAVWQYIDHLTSEIVEMRRELDRLQDEEAMRESAGLRAWHQGRTI